MAKIKKSGDAADAASNEAKSSPLGPQEERTFGPDRKGESSAGAVSSKDKERAVEATRDGSNNR